MGVEGFTQLYRCDAVATSSLTCRASRRPNATDTPAAIVAGPQSAASRTRFARFAHALRLRQQGDRRHPRHALQEHRVLDEHREREGETRGNSGSCRAPRILVERETVEHDDRKAGFVGAPLPQREVEHERRAAEHDGGEVERRPVRPPRRDRQQPERDDERQREQPLQYLDLGHACHGARDKADGLTRESAAREPGLIRDEPVAALVRVEDDPRRDALHHLHCDRDAEQHAERAAPLPVEERPRAAGDARAMPRAKLPRATLPQVIRSRPDAPRASRT